MSETYKKIYRLKEFNIFRESADDYLLAAVDGTQIALDANGARFFFLLESTPVDEMDALLATHGLPQPDHGLLYELIAAGFLQIVEEKIDPPFDVERALKNVEKPNLGPLTLQELAITLSDACPLNCSYCFRKNDGAKGKLDHETVERVLQEFADLAGRTLNISGGEPAVFARDVIHCATKAKELGIPHVSVNTSGVGVTRKILEDWQAAGIECLNLSLDTLDPERSEKLLGQPGGVEAALSVLQNAGKIGLFTHVNMTLFQENLDELEDFIDLSRQDGVTVRVNLYVPLGERPPISPRNVRKTIDYIKELEKEGASIYTPVDPEEEWPEYFVCAGGLTRATVENNGTLGGCQFMMGKLGPTGTVMKEGLTKLWQEGDFSVFREGTREPTLECKECEDRAYCVAGCLAFDLGLEEQGRVCPNK